MRIGNRDFLEHEIQLIQNNWPTHIEHYLVRNWLTRFVKISIGKMRLETLKLTLA